MVNQVCCPKEDRHLDILLVESKRNKITINPCSGRITLKVDKETPDNLYLRMIELAMKFHDLDFEPVTLRGKIKYHEKYGFEWSGHDGSGARKVTKTVREFKPKWEK
jgi:hypothetical protein